MDNKLIEYKMSRITEIVRTMVAPFVMDDSSLIVKPYSTEKGILVKVEAPAEDVGIIVGKNGNNINAMRVYLRHVGIKDGSLYHLEVNENV